MFNTFNKEFFICLIEQINQEKIEYCIIGDYKNLPDSVEHDLDIWTNDLEKFSSSIQRTAIETGFKFLLVNKTSNGFNSVLFKRIADSICVIKLDILTDCSYKSFLTLADEKTFDKHRKLHNGFFVADEEIEALVHFLYPLLEWGKIKDKYKIEILENYRSELFTNTIINLFGKDKAKFIYSSIENGEWNKIEELRLEFLKTALVRFLFNHNFKQFKKGVLLIYYNLKRLFLPSGYSITFCGLDGAGKTTLIEILNDLFISVFKKKKVFLGYWRPFVLPELRELIGKKNSKSSELMDNRKPELQAESKGFFLSFMKLIYYWIDYLLGKFKFINIRNKGGFVLFDRHYLDMIVHPQRFQMNLPKPILRFFYRLTPKNDFTFFFWANPETIHSRKIEFTKEEIINQTQVYMNEGKLIKNFIHFETNKSIIEEINEILTVISKSRFND